MRVIQRQDIYNIELTEGEEIEVLIDSVERFARVVPAGKSAIVTFKYVESE